MRNLFVDFKKNLYRIYLFVNYFKNIRNYNKWEFKNEMMYDKFTNKNKFVWILKFEKCHIFWYKGSISLFLYMWYR